MISEEEIRKMVYDKSKIEEKIYQRPQTITTLLKQCYNNGTLQAILRRKLGNSWKEGNISKIVVPGTRRGLVIFTGNDKKYNIAVEDSRVGVNIYYFFKHEWKNDFVVKIQDYWKLENNRWVHHEGEKIISRGSILKWI